MKTFIANFGLSNFMWPDCLRTSTIATIDDESVHPFWEAGDRNGYVEHSLAHLKTARGETPTRPVASRWYGLMDVIAQTSDDIWFHRERDELWWTTSTANPMQIELVAAQDAKRDGPRVYRLSKPCGPWSNRTRKGAPLSWVGLHPKAKDFLFTEGTLQQLQPENAAYASALLDGDDLSEWEGQPTWKAKASIAGHGSMTTFDARRKSVWYMVDTVRKTVAAANGQQVLRTIKGKLCSFTDEELSVYVDALISEQEGTCALTGLQLHFQGRDVDPAMLCSLDRIDSDRHYERGNLQVVCRLVNQWKGASRDEEFRRLVGLVRGQQLDL